MLLVAPTARVSPLADIEDSVRGSRIEIGEHVVIDSFVKIKPAGGSGDLVIGPRTVINSGCVLYTGHGLRIGACCAIAANCTFAPTNHAFARRDTLIMEQGFQESRGGITVEDDCWIGAGTVLLDGAHVGRGAVIGAASVVRGRIEPYTVNAGHPLRLVGRRG